MRTFNNHFIGLDLGFTQDTVYVESWTADNGKQCLNTVVLGSMQTAEGIDKFLKSGETLTLTRQTPIFIDESRGVLAEELKDKGWNVVNKRISGTNQTKLDKVIVDHVNGIISIPIDDSSLLSKETAKKIADHIKNSVDYNDKHENYLIVEVPQVTIEKTEYNHKHTSLFPKTQSMSRKVKSELAGIKDRLDKLEENSKMSSITTRDSDTPYHYLLNNTEVMIPLEDGLALQEKYGRDSELFTMNVKSDGTRERVLTGYVDLLPTQVHEWLGNNKQ